MGKEGLRLVLTAFENEGIKKEDAPRAAEYYLENYRFIYKNPDDNTVCFPYSYIFSDFTVVPQGNKGAFMSPLVSACLAVHLKKSINNAIQYGYPVGALAIATAVVRISGFILLYRHEKTFASFSLPAGHAISNGTAHRYFSKRPYYRAIAFS